MAVFLAPLALVEPDAGGMERAFMAMERAVIAAEQAAMAAQHMHAAGTCDAHCLALEAGVINATFNGVAGIVLAMWLVWRFGLNLPTPAAKGASAPQATDADVEDLDDAAETSEQADISPGSQQG